MTFSFIDDPLSALQTVEQLANAIQGGHSTIKIDQSACKELDLCAASVLNALVLSARRQYRLNLEGSYPAFQEAKDIVLATGLPAELGLTQPAKHFLTYKLVRGQTSPISAFRNTLNEHHTQELARYIDRCLGRYGFSLTPGGRDMVAKLAGEVISNAEEHSGQDYWWIAAYLRQPEGQSYGDCHLTIFNLGSTLAESLQGLPPGSKLRRNIEALVDQHRDSRFWSPKWTEENLWTLYALQEGVSAMNVEAERLGHRGQGTVKMIETFQELGRTSAGGVEPMMCVLSGNTHILFDNRFRLAPVPTERGEVRQVIAFNAANDLRQPPDAGTVTHLARRFPGTLISLRFYLDPKYLQTVGRQHGKNH